MYDYDYEYINTRRVSYKGGATFVPVCMKCGRYVKADEVIHVNGCDGGLIKKPNATCKKCGRTEMVFEGFFDEQCEVFGSDAEETAPAALSGVNKS